MAFDRNRVVRNGFYFVLLLIIFVLQNTKGVCISLWDASPDYILFFVAAEAVFEGPYSGGTLGFFAGLLLSISSPWPEGLEALFLGCFGVLAGISGEKYLRPVLPSALLVGSAGMVLRSLIAYVFYYRLVYGMALWTMCRHLLVQLGLSLVFAPLFFVLIRSIYRRFMENEI